MEQIPSVWRTELWHPMLIHFPVVTLLLATIAGLLCFSMRNSIFLKQLVPVMLCIGVPTGWLAIYTGLLSYNVVVRQICDPEVLQEHYWWGYTAVIIYSVALFCWILSKWLIKGRPMLLQSLVLLLMLAGAGALSYCGHLGASVVYQQGGGTYKPSANCTEFEK
ncbi:DUF2231 domain-containing protein [Pedobacter nyackensis]|uniref:DUF2231 domain-containing protein n=1 Tax=Pedobacter nyackensis TaxID=475255 RepID=UPI00292EF20D|nr:DUF2231 domain-containing protein [Pedobacter nyackensis]